MGFIVVIWTLLFVGCRNSLSIHNHMLRRLQLALWRPAEGFPGQEEQDVTWQK